MTSTKPSISASTQSSNTSSLYLALPNNSCHHDCQHCLLFIITMITFQLLADQFSHVQPELKDTVHTAIEHHVSASQYFKTHGLVSTGTHTLRHRSTVHTPNTVPSFIVFCFLYHVYWTRTCTQNAYTFSIKCIIILQSSG